MNTCSEFPIDSLLRSSRIPVRGTASMKRTLEGESSLQRQRALTALMAAPDSSTSAEGGHEESKGNGLPPAAPPPNFTARETLAYMQHIQQQQQHQQMGSNHLANSLRPASELEYGNLMANTIAPPLTAPSTNMSQNHQWELHQRLLAMRAGAAATTTGGQGTTSLGQPNSFLGGDSPSIQAAMLQRLMAEQQRNRAFAAQAHHQMQQAGNPLLGSSGDYGLQLSRARALLGGSNDARNLMGLSHAALGGFGRPSSQDDRLQQALNLQANTAPSSLPSLPGSHPGSSVASSSMAPQSSGTSAASSRVSPVPPMGMTASLTRPSPSQARKRKASNSGAQQRGRSSPTAAIHSVPHHRERDYSALGVEEDENWLSSFQCFVRKDLMEVVKASEFDVMVRSTSKSILPNQVGVRCRFCAHLPPGSRTSRSSAFPSSIDKLYQSFSMMVRDHFVHCSELPTDLFQRFQTLKSKNAQGATDSKQYWVYAARKLGMYDADKGIQSTDTSMAAAQKMLPYGMTDLSLLVGARAQDPPLLNDPQSDKRKLTPFLLQLLKHLRIVHLMPSEQVGKRKGLPVGLEGLGCKYCFEKGRLGFSRCFPLRRRALPSHVHDLFQHCLRCTLCPPEVKTKLTSVFNSKVDTLNKVEKEVESFSFIWDKLGRKRDLTTS